MPNNSEKFWTYLRIQSNPSDTFEESLNQERKILDDSGILHNHRIRATTEYWTVYASDEQLVWLQLRSQTSIEIINRYTENSIFVEWVKNFGLPGPDTF